MSLTRSVLVTTPVVRSKEVDSVWQERPFKLQVGQVVTENTLTLSKIEERIAIMQEKIDGID